MALAVPFYLWGAAPALPGLVSALLPAAVVYGILRLIVGPSVWCAFRDNLYSVYENYMPEIVQWALRMWSENVIKPIGKAIGDAGELLLKKAKEVLDGLGLGAIADQLEKALRGLGMTGQDLVKAVFVLALVHFVYRRMA